LNYLIDTHILLWALEDDPRLSNTYRQLLNSVENQIFVSIGSLWEMSIKMSLGKLEPKRVMSQFIEEHVIQKGLQILTITGKHLDQLSSLPLHHRDPFDRLLISQAMSEDFPLLTSDDIFKKYDVKLI
jgi:PIN domain nuclease of toxin-antitoxin system